MAFYIKETLKKLFSLIKNFISLTKVKVKLGKNWLSTNKIIKVITKNERLSQKLRKKIIFLFAHLSKKCVIQTLSKTLSEGKFSKLTKTQNLIVSMKLKPFSDVI